MAKQQLFTIAALLHPKVNEKGIAEGDTEIIFLPDYILAINERVAGQMAVRKLDSRYENDLDRIEIIVRAFL